jgi:PTH1 family peptidyl-tRNA hydrolase
MRLIVGLGNPGKDYAKSKHNIGFMVLDSYAKTHQLKFIRETKFQGEYVKLSDSILLKPRTYMNNSGLSVRAVAQFYQIKNEDILIVSDDLDLPFSKIRLREKGSAGGHNGLKSIIEHLGGQNFNRLRIGIDRDDNKDVVNYVLGKLSKEQKKNLENLFIETNNIIENFISGQSFEQIMNTYNPSKSL